jgi:hypothetical membrane protein
MSGFEERRGPLVHRSVRHGAILWVIASVQFILAMAITQAGWTGSTYSLRTNYISDLGATGCGTWGGRWVCSPWHDVFDVSIILLGILLILGAILVRSAFPPRGTRTVGLGMFWIAAVGAMMVGLSPENVNLTVHSTGATIAFLLGNLSLLVLGVAMFRDTRWDGYRAFTMLLGLIGLIAFVLFLVGTYGPLGVGGMERLIVAPLLLWLIVAGIHLWRIPTFAPSAIPHSSSA